MVAVIWQPGKDKYYVECPTHTISRTCHGDHWIVALWDKQRRTYMQFRKVVTLDEQKAAVQELKDYALTASGTRAA